MFRSLGSVFCVVVMAAFIFGCGGGGGGGTTPDPEPPVVTPVPPTDTEELIAETRQMVATILTNARAEAARASSAASGLRTNADATADQITRADNHNRDAQAALTLIENANSAAIAATTPAAAQTALDNARTAQGTLSTAALAISSIQGIVQAVTNARMQREANELALTNGSSLIQHVRDNKLVSDAILENLGLPSPGTNPDPLEVGGTSAANLATYPANDTTSTPRVTGVRGVTVTVGGAAFTSDSQTSALSGTGILPHGFDPKNPAASGTFVNAYTDISQTRKDVSLTRRGDNPATNTTTEPYNHSYSVRMDVADTDYLLTGIWLDSNNVLKAFAYGSQPLSTDRTSTTANAGEAAPNAAFLECLGVAQNTNNTCTDASSFTNIADFVAAGQDVSATYRGDANGVYLAAGATSYFEADVELNAEFNNPSVGTDNGSIEGEITNIVAGGQSIAGSIELQTHTFAETIGAAFGGNAIGVVEGNAYSGLWEGQFFGQRVSSAQKPSTDALNTDTDPATSATTFSAQAPGSVAGTFYATQQSAPVRDAAFIGAFGAHR